MEIAALILATVSLLISTAVLVLILVKHFSTHTIQYEPVTMDKLEKSDAKTNKKVQEIQDEEEDWL